MTWHKFIQVCVGVFLFWISSCLNSNMETSGTSEVGNSSQISGTVKTSNGEVLAGISVMALPSNFNPLQDTIPGNYQTVTDSTGKYSLNVDSIGNYNVQFNSQNNHEGYLAQNIEVNKDTTELDVSMEKSSAILISANELPKEGAFYIAGTSIKLVIDPIQQVDEEIIIQEVPPGQLTEVYYQSTHEDSSLLISKGDTLSPGDTVTLSIYQAWKYHKKINFNTTDTGERTNETVYNIPLLIRLDSSNINFNLVNPYGDDIRFSDFENKPLNYHIQSWNLGNKTALVWIQLDSLIANSNLQTVNLHYGNDYSMENERKKSVFDTTLGYVGVWHLDEKPFGEGSQARDETDNYHHASFKGGMDLNNQLEAVVGTGIRFDGVDDYVDLGTIHSDFTVGYTICSWSYFEAFNFWSRIIDLGNSSGVDNIVIANQMYGDSIAVDMYNNPTDSSKLNHPSRLTHMSAPGLALNQWQNVCATFETKSLTGKIFLDGRKIAEKKLEFAPTPVDRVRCYLAKSNWINDGWLKGRLDEVQIINQIRSEEWIKANYNSQKPDNKLVQIEN